MITQYNNLSYLIGTTTGLYLKEIHDHNSIRELSTEIRTTLDWLDEHGISYDVNFSNYTNPMTFEPSTKIYLVFGNTIDSTLFKLKFVT